MTGVIYWQKKFFKILLKEILTKDWNSQMLKWRCSSGEDEEMGISSNRYEVCFIPQLLVVPGAFSVLTSSLWSIHRGSFKPPRVFSTLICSQQVTSASLLPRNQSLPIKSPEAHCSPVSSTLSLWSLGNTLTHQPIGPHPPPSLGPGSPVTSSFNLFSFCLCPSAAYASSPRNFPDLL